MGTGGVFGPKTGTGSPGPPGDHPQPRCRVPAGGRSRAGPPGSADRARPPGRLFRLRPVRAVCPGHREQPEHDRLRSDRPGQELLREDLPLAPGGLRTSGLGRRPERRVRRTRRRLGHPTDRPSARRRRPAQPARPRARRRGEAIRGGRPQHVCPRRPGSGGADGRQVELLASLAAACLGRVLLPRERVAVDLALATVGAARACPHPASSGRGHARTDGRGRHQHPHRPDDAARGRPRCRP